ncbi:MAG: biotin synthase BioB [Candidatus Omnitrophica bacterium]|nr:biotin synthase BioB [Candidatus Omnitrophota bacterium]MDD5352946.1 biotin synthase BioB [Candidatus Omnitrophota bacterium]MDD5550545.1 biotin synthase BioB [Candidatus Omnitrophota bacterium]
MQKIIEKIEEKVLQEKDLSFDESLALAGITEYEDLFRLFMAANSVKEKFRSDSVDLCALTNAKSGSCPENCAFCAQSAHSKTKAKTYPLINAEEILKHAEKAVVNKTHRFCIVTSGCSVNEEELKEICKAIRLIKNKFPHLKMDASLGKLNKENAKLLKDAGLDRYNHNIETAESNFHKVCSTHSFKDRLKTLEILKEVGIEICCGGIIGLGETDRERIELAFYLKKLDVDCIPLNFLNPVPGTRFENNKIPSPLELLKFISIFRLILPAKQIRICGGRQSNLGQLQSLIFFAGADAIIIGDYLTTKGSSPHQDLQMISNLGLKV